jgi:hypothetical protein
MVDMLDLFMAKKGSSIAIILVVFCLAGWQVWSLSSTKEPSVLAETTTKTLEERVKSLENRVYVLEKNAGLVGTKTTAKTKETFVSLAGGEISSLDWAKISGSDFTLDTSLYGKTVEVSWQGWLEGSAGAIRLYDSTNHRVVDFSEYASNGDGKRSFYTKAVSIWRGQNQYYIEGKVVGGTMTLSAPRLKVIVK